MAQRTRLFLLLLGPFPLALFVAIASPAFAQTQQQYLYGSLPVTSATSEVLAYSKNATTGGLSATSNSPLADNSQGGALAIDGQGRFLFVLNPGTSTISMFNIDQTTGNISEVSGSPFSMGPTENLSMAAKSPVCLATERSGQFLYVGYQFGNFTGEGAVNEFQIDSINAKLLPLPIQQTVDIRSSPIGMFTDSRGTHLYVGLGLNAATGADDGGTLVYSVDALTGQLSPVGSAGNSTISGKSIALDPQGRFFFDGWGGTNFNPGTIESALISPADGTAILGISTVTLAQNVIPLAMLVEGSGKFLYVQQNSSPQAYSINQTTGALTTLSSATAALNFKPGTAVADPLGPYLYSLQSDGLHGFQIDPQSGGLSELPGSPFSTASGTPGTLAISGASGQALSGPVAAFFPPSENLGNVTIGQSSNSQTVTLTNTGSQGLSVNAVAIAGTNSGDFTFTSNCTFPTVLAPNATCNINVVFSPAATGIRQGVLQATDNAPGSPQSVALTGTGVAAQPGVTLSPANLTFPATAQGSTSAAQTLTVTNAGGATLHISSVLLSGSNPGDFALTNLCTGVLAVNSSCTIAATFSPQAAGLRSASIAIADDAPGSPQSASLSGTGTALPPNTPAAVLSTSAVSFGAVTQGTVASPQAVRLISSGTSPLHISSVVLSGSNAADLTLNNGCGPGAYAVNAACTIAVAFAPFALGTRLATITVTDDAANSPQAITIAASVNPALTITPATPGGTSVSVAAGQTANFNLQLTPGPGFSGSVSFSCTGAPFGATCTAPAASLASGPVPYTVSVNTTGTGMTAPDFRWLRFGPAPNWRTLPLVVLLVWALSWLARGSAKSVRLMPRYAPLAVLVLVCSLGLGCGSASVTRTSAQSPQLTVTPQGNSIITLTPSITVGGRQLPGLAPVQLTLTVN